MVWCPDPERECTNLGCEDWCNDDSNCPLKRKDSRMFILVNDNQLTTRMLHEFPVIVEISEDGKTFKVINHQKFKESMKQEYHISMLKHILMAGNE